MTHFSIEIELDFNISHLDIIYTSLQFNNKTSKFIKKYALAKFNVLINRVCLNYINLKPSEDNLDIRYYTQTLIKIKNKAQVKAILAVNTELLKLYWTIGNIIVRQQEQNAWATNVIEKLAKDLQNLLPGLGGFSRANVFRMSGFYLAYEKVAQNVRQLEDLPIFNIPWSP